MPAPLRTLHHFFIAGGGEKEPYTARSSGGGAKQPPPRDRAAHAEKLSSELAAAVSVGRELLAERPVDTAVDESVRDRGFYIEFALETGSTTSDALGRLEDIRKGIEIVAIRASSGDVAGETIATVFVPERSSEHFARRVEQFRDETTGKGRPRNDMLVATINTIQLATPRSVFTDADNTFPTDEQQELWWELWIRKGFGAQVETVGQRVGIVSKPHIMSFAEREVKVIRGSLSKLSHLMQQTDGVAELRLANDNPAFFMRESNVDQALWSADTTARLLPLNGSSKDAVAVCILDGGVMRAHPLLQPRIELEDVHTINPAWGGADDAPASHAGHGTGMAGLVLYGDLSQVLPGSGPIEVPFRLESVKILPPAGVNEPESYAAITFEAIGRAEAAAPKRYRIICSAVTAENSGDGGRPSSWSAALDLAAFGAFGERRLIVVAAGNIRDLDATWVSDYVERNDTAELESPAQAWNVLTVGATTEKVNLLDSDFSGWHALAELGDLCPSSRTSMTWEPQWPIKPDVVLEGGNYAHDGGPYIDTPDDLRLLTANYKLAQRLLTTFGDTSAAAALCANLAARIAASRPSVWPETVRALIVHSAEWTPVMLQRMQAAAPAVRKRVLLHRYGYGIPDLTRAVRSATNDLTLVVEEVIRPFRLDGSSVKTREMSIHSLPWPAEALTALGETDVELRVTLSYFVEPNPGERGWIKKHRYASYGLRFDVKRQLESDDLFRGRLSRAVQVDEDDTVTTSGSDGWVLGAHARNVGSVHSDVWKGTAADLARRGAIGVYPVGGWWREQKRLNRYNNETRYSLVASIRVPNQDVDIYTPVQIALGVQITPMPIEIITEI